VTSREQARASLIRFPKMRHAHLNEWFRVAESSYANFIHYVK